MKFYKSDYINFRIKRAEESFNDAKYLIEKGSWNAAINRFYYSCFYAALALSIQHDTEAKSHKGVRGLLGQKFIKTGIIPKEFGQIYSDCSILDKKEIMVIFLILMLKRLFPSYQKWKSFLSL